MLIDSEVQERIESFFVSYEQLLLEGFLGEVTLERLSDIFSVTFIESNSREINLFSPNEKFKTIFLKELGFYKSIGISKMVIDYIGLTELDALHYIAKVQWKGYYINRSKAITHLRFQSSYLLKTQYTKTNILAYFPGSELKVMLEEGLIN